MLKIVGAEFNGDFDAVLSDLKDGDVDKALLAWVGQIEDNLKGRIMFPPEMSPARRHAQVVITDFGVAQVIGCRNIRNGTLNCCEVVPLIDADRTPQLATFFMGADPNHYLDRHNHDSKGIHYHYLDRRKKRSDIILTFRRQKVQGAYPVTWQVHAGKNADFEARVDSWGAKRKYKVRSVCETDLKKWRICDYLRPDINAQDLV